MFDDTIVQILGNNPQNIKFKNILVDVQEYNQDVEIQNYKLSAYKRLYVDYIEPLIMENIYLKIENEIVQVIKVNRYCNYLEVYVCRTVNVKINGIDKNVIIQDNYLKDKIDYKTIITENEFNTGDLIQYQNTNWLVISEVSQNNSIYKATIRKCQYSLKFYNKREKIFQTHCVVDINNQGIQQGKFFNYLDGKMELYIKDSETHRKLNEDKRFIMMGYAWNIEGISRELPGIIHLYCKKDTFLNEDNKELEIAYNNNDNIKPTEPTPTEPTNPVNLQYSIQGSDTLDNKTIQTYTIVDQNSALAKEEFEFSFEKFDYNMPVNLFTIRGSGFNSISLLGVRLKGEFILKATCKGDGTIIVKKNVKVVKI